ncbi:hypothetical protein CDO51_11475, partial [Natranaerobius trueperi]
DFALGFLQTPPHDGRPCHLLTVPATKPVADFHRLATAHAGQTEKGLNPKSFTFGTAPCIRH